MNKLAVAIFVVVMHSLVLLSCSPAPRKYPEVKTSVKQKDESDFKFVDQRRNGTGLSCEKSYRGVGFKDDWAGHIIEVAPGSPAEQAGIIVGDRLAQDDYYKNLDIGTIVVMKIERNGQLMELTLRIDDICYEQ